MASNPYSIRNRCVKGEDHSTDEDGRALAAVAMGPRLPVTGTDLTDVAGTLSEKPKKVKKACFLCKVRAVCSSVLIS